MKKHIPITLLLIILTVVVNGQTTQSAQSDSSADNSDFGCILRIEIESEFPGGQEAWLRFLQKNLAYPSTAIKRNIQGTVILQFKVCKDGTLCDRKAISGPIILQGTALNVLKKSPRWKPAIKNGRNVDSYKRQPVVFRLKGSCSI
jgi:periplasmic protein TonB